jgi:hypothetical protein
VQITCEWFLYLKEQQITIGAPQFQALFSPDTDLEFASLPLINTAQHKLCIYGHLHLLKQISIDPQIKHNDMSLIDVAI